MSTYNCTHLSNNSTHTRPRVLRNPRASSSSKEYQHTTNPAIAAFHAQLPDYGDTKLHSLPSVAKQLGFAHVFVKDESTRFGLPSFKIAGSSWSMHQVLCQQLHLPPATSLADLQTALKGSDLTIVTTTEGNWGRSVGRMAKYYGLKSRIYVPGFMPVYTQNLIRGEGAEVIVLKDGSYDDSVAAAIADSKKTGALLVMDVAFDDYVQIPRWVSDGYSTILTETDRQVREATGGKGVDIASSSVGAGSWAQAVVEHYKSRSPESVMVTVEPEAATSLKESLHVGVPTTTKTGESIMNGMNCGTISDIAWPVLRDGVNLAVAIKEREAHEAVQELQALEINAGPCGAANLVALRAICGSGELKKEDQEGKVVVLFSTEGTREYEVPK